MINNNPLVSIIVISFNAEKTIIETLESIKNQTYRPIELVITDDCSNDHTAEICNQWITDNKEHFTQAILIANKENHGVSANANIGVSASTGTWIKLIGDDILFPDAIQANLDYASSHNSLIVASQVISFNNDTKENITLIPSNTKHFPTENKQQFVCLLKSKLKAPSPTWFIKRSIYMELGRFDETYRQMEDMPFLFKYLKKGYTLAFLSRPTVFYRITNNSLSHSRKKSGQQKQEFFLTCNNFFQKMIKPELIRKKMYGYLLFQICIQHCYGKKIYAKDSSLSRYFYGAILSVLIHK